MLLYYMYASHFFWILAHFSPAAAGLFSRSWQRGAQEARLHTTAQVRPRPGSVARALGVQTRQIWQVVTGSLSAELEPSKITENPHIGCFATAVRSLYFVAATVQSAVAHQVGVNHYYACVGIAYACTVCAMISVRVCARGACGFVYVCAGTPHFSFGVFRLLYLLLLLLPYNVCITPSSQAL